MSESEYDARTARDQLYDIVRSDAPFEVKARDALELGKDYLNVANGHLTRIDTDLGHWEATVSTDPPDGQFPPGLELDLDTTYCRRVLDADESIKLHDAPEQGWAEDPAFQTHGLHCYHGTTLRVDGDPRGTICFVDEEPRSQPFSPDETMFAELLTRLLERELERHHHETQLLRQSNLATVLNRILRHNLRNDMTVIRGHTQVLSDRVEDDSPCETILDTVDELLALSQKARELDQFLAGHTERQSTELGSLLDRVAEAVTTQYPMADISVHVDNEIKVEVRPEFDRALEELVENAAKHGGPSATVRIKATKEPNSATIRISDDGPGLPAHEHDVLERGMETPLAHGSGLGLWLAHWIVTSHEGTLDATVDESGTTVTISISRVPDARVDGQLTELRRARDQYKQAFEEAADAMLLLNDDARILDANRQAAEVYGADREELIGRSIDEYLPDIFPFESAWRSFQQAEEEKDTLTIEAADGTDRAVEYSTTADVLPGQHLVIVREQTAEP